MTHWVDNRGSIRVSADERILFKLSGRWSGHIGAAGVRAASAWGCRGSAGATDDGAKISKRQAGRSSQGGRTRLTRRTPKTTVGPSAGRASRAE